MEKGVSTGPTYTVPPSKGFGSTATCQLYSWWLVSSGHDHNFSTHRPLASAFLWIPPSPSPLWAMPSHLSRDISLLQRQF